MAIFDKIKKLIDEGKKDEADKVLAEHIANEKTGIEKKNNELLAKLAKQKDEMKKMNERLSAIEEDKRKADEEIAAKSGDIDKIKTQLTERLTEKYTKQLEELTNQNKQLNDQLHAHVVGEGLTSALAKAGVAPQYMDAAKALITSTTKIEIDDDNGQPFAKINGEKVTDFISTWAQSDSGKHFVSAKANSGGGSNGTTNGGDAIGGKQMTRSAFEILSPSEKMEFSKSGGTLTDD